MPRQGAPHCGVSGPVGPFRAEQGQVGRGVRQWVDLPKSMKMADGLGAMVGNREAN